MNVLSVIIVLSIAAICVSIFIKDKKGKVVRGDGVVMLHVDADSSVGVTKEEDGITVRIRYATFEDRPSDQELFPDIVNEPVKSDYALDEIFWNRLSHIDEMEPQQRNDLLNKLQEHGFIRSSDITRISFQLNEGENAFLSDESSGDGDMEDEYPDIPEDFYRPFY